MRLQFTQIYSEDVKETYVQANKVWKLANRLNAPLIVVGQYGNVFHPNLMQKNPQGKQ